MKNSKGISMVVLVVTIVVMIIIISITFRSGESEIDFAQTMTLEEERANITQAAVLRYTRYARNSEVYPLIGDSVDSSIANTIYNLAHAEDDTVTLNDITSMVSSDIDAIRIIDSSDANELGVKNINNSHYFIVNYKKGKVYGPTTI